MRVVIIGAGEVGTHLAERLIRDKIDVVLVEQDPIRAAEIDALLDVQVITGSGSSIQILEQAGIAEADLCVAVTQIDEVNLIASLLAHQSGAKASVVRVENEDFRGPKANRLLNSMSADVVIDPDAETADEILDLLRLTGADEVHPMAEGQLVIIGVVIGEHAALVNHSYSQIASQMGDDWEFLVGVVNRGKETFRPKKSDLLLAGDHLRVICKAHAQTKLLRTLGASRRRARKVIVLGGGAVGKRVAKRLGLEGAEVTIIERNPKRAAHLGEKLRMATVIEGDITNTELLMQERIGSADAVVAASGEDSSNVLACAFAVREGATYTVALIHRLALLPLIKDFGIDATVSPRTASANAVLRVLRGGMGVATFLESDFEIDEIAVRRSSQADGVAIADLPLPSEVLIGAIVFKDKPAEIARGSSRLEAGNKIVVFGNSADLAVVRSLVGD